MWLKKKKKEAMTTGPYGQDFGSGWRCFIFQKTHPTKNPNIG